MSDRFKQTVRIIRESKVRTDDLGRQIWNQPVEPVELDLVSTGELQKLLDANDDVAVNKIEQAALQEPNQDAVLAHDTENDSYEFVDAQGNDEFSLVSTQMLFKILEQQNPGKKPAKTGASPKAEPVDKTSGFDPYNSG